MRLQQSVHAAEVVVAGARSGEAEEIVETGEAEAAASRPEPPLAAGITTPPVEIIIVLVEINPEGPDTRRTRQNSVVTAITNLVTKLGFVQSP